jgi:hypothetical protein
MLQFVVIIVIAVLRYVRVKFHKKQDAMTNIEKDLVCAFIVLSHCIKILKGISRGM